MKSLFCFAFLSVSLWGSTVTVSMSGTWGTLSQSDAYFASNEAWSLSFQVANPPTVIGPSPTLFGMLYNNSTYILNGNPVVLSGNQVFFYTDYSLTICLDATCNNQIGAFAGSPKLFSGNPSSPTMVPGMYLLTSGVGADERPFLNIGDSTDAVTLSIASGAVSAPEPASWILVACRRVTITIGRTSL